MKNFEQVYDARLAPLMDDIYAICKEYGIPMVASFQLTEEKQPLFCTFALAPKGTANQIRVAANSLFPVTNSKTR